VCFRQVLQNFFVSIRSGMLLPILGGRVIPVFAIVALQRDDFAHKPSSKLLDNLRDGACADRVAAFADREA